MLSSFDYNFSLLIEADMVRISETYRRKTFPWPYNVAVEKYYLYVWGASQICTRQERELMSEKPKHISETTN